MNAIKVFRILEESGFSKQNATELISELEEQDTRLATRQNISDLELRIHQMEVKMLQGFLQVQESMGAQTWRFLGALTVIGVVFKLAELIIHYTWK